jgi:two-component system response regulator QseB
MRISLTPTESALLDVLTRSPEHVFSREELVGAVFAAGDAPGSVDTYVHYVRRKSVPEMIETVRGLGYRIGSPT